MTSARTALARTASSHPASALSARRTSARTALARMISARTALARKALARTASSHPVLSRTASALSARRTSARTALARMTSAQPPPSASDPMLHGHLCATLPPRLRGMVRRALFQHTHLWMRSLVLLWQLLATTALHNPCHKLRLRHLEQEHRATAPRARRKPRAGRHCSATLRQRRTACKCREIPRLPCSRHPPPRRAWYCLKSSRLLDLFHGSSSCSRHWCRESSFSRPTRACQGSLSRLRR